jgi:hypothetical protein
MLVLENTQRSNKWLDEWHNNFAKKIKAGKFNHDEAEKAVTNYIIPAARGRKSLSWAVGNDFTPDSNIDPKKVNKAEVVNSILEHGE